MITAQHNWFYKPFFDWYVNYIINKDFKSVEIHGEWQNLNKPTLFIGNHISWWDGFWTLYLNNIFLYKKLHVMMLESELKNRKFLSKAGAFSINPGTKSTVKTLRYTKRILSNENNGILMYPQGHICSLYDDIPDFEKGVEKIISNNIEIQLYAAFVDYLSDRKPTLSFYLKTLTDIDHSADKLQNTYNSFFKESKAMQIKNAIKK